MASTEEQQAPARTRCYWAILDTGMAFQYLDPLFQQHMHEQSADMIGKSLVDFIHPEEKQVAQEDFAKFKSSTSIFGSVTRCRYARVSHCRRILGAQDVKDEDSEAEGADKEWVAARITSSLVANNTVLAFFHSMPEEDNTSSANRNNCGPDGADISVDYMTPSQVEMLTKAFTTCQNASDLVKNTRPEEKAAMPPNYVFQLLSTNSDAIYFTWPPSRPTGDNMDLAANGPIPQEGDERYSPVEYAALAKSVALPQTVPDAGEASTNCTKRYQSKHPVLMDSGFTNVESVVITYQSLTFVCFQSGGILLNRNTFTTMPDLRVGDPNAMKRKDDFSEDEAIKRLRTANMQHDDQDTPVPILDLAQWQNNVPQQGVDDGTGQQQQQQYPGMQGNNTQIPTTWTSDDPNNQNNLQSPYYGGSAYPSVYSNMFSNDGRTSGFMGGSTNIPPMPAPSGPSTSNGLQNLALASTSSYYSDYNPNGGFNVDGTPNTAGTGAAPASAGDSDAAGSGEKSVVIHRVRKNDRGRMCTSCGTTNSPEWRKGPAGIKTLCNACGLRYSRAQARKAKKAAKEADALIAASGGAPASTSNNNSAENISTSYSIPTPLQIPNTASTATSGGPPSAGTPHSPYLPIGDYQVHAPLPPLPQSTHDDQQQQQQPHSAGSANGSGHNIPIGAGNGNNSYSSFVNYPYDQWNSPVYDQSFAAQQQQGQ